MRFLTTMVMGILLTFTGLFWYQELHPVSTEKPLSRQDLSHLRTEILRDVNRDVSVLLKFNGISKGWEWRQKN